MVLTNRLIDLWNGIEPMNKFLNIWSNDCVCICIVCIHVCMLWHMLVEYMCTHIPNTVKARGQHWLSFSISVSLILWILSQNSLLQLVSLANWFCGSCFCLLCTMELLTGHHAYLAVTWMLGSEPHVSVVSAYISSHLSSPMSQMVFLSDKIIKQRQNPLLTNKQTNWLERWLSS